MIKVELSHRFAGIALEIAFEAPKGVTAVFGRSGAGKTSLVNAMAGTLRPDTSRISVGERMLSDSAAGIWVPAHQRRIGYVFQDGRLFPHLDVRKNLRFGTRFAQGRAGPSEIEIIDLLGISHLLGRMPATLSGGEKQRVAIGRALLAAPELILMDEPLASLDAARKSEILPFLMQLRDKTAVPILYVSHSLSEVALLANTLVLLDQGKTIAAGPIADLLSDPALVPYLGAHDAGSILSGKITGHHEDGLSELEVCGGRLMLPTRSEDIGTKLRVRIEAHDVILSAKAPVGLSALNILSGVVRDIHIGKSHGAIVQVDLGGEYVLARITQRSVQAMKLAIGQPIFAILKTVAVAQGDIGVVGNG